MSLPFLQPITPHQKSDCELQIVGKRIHRKEMAYGWSSILWAYTVGEALFFFEGDQEYSVLMPYDFAPHTISEDVFHEYLSKLLAN